MEIIHMMATSCGFREWSFRNGYVTPSKKCKCKLSINTRCQLHVAFENGHLEIVTLLLQKGANVSCKYYDGNFMWL